jgi:FkbM family methyltransferase
MGALWYECREFDAFPVRCRAWRRWCASGPKHKGGTSIGGGHLFRMLRRSLQHRPVGDANYWPVPSVRLDRPLYVDLLDLQSYIHTVPILSRGSNEFNLQERLLAPGMVFADIGANYGLYTFRAAQLVGPSGRVVAFEPQPRLVGALKRTLRHSPLVQVELLEVALADRPGRASFAIPDMASGAGSLLVDGVHGPRFEVELARFDDVSESLNLARLDLVKIDVEGGEWMVLQGAAETLRRHQPHLWFEWNANAQQQSGVNGDAFFAFLGGLGYRVFRRIVSGYPQFDPCASGPGLVNVLAVPGGREFCP